jgi:two-component system response regulator YesN
MDRLVIVEDNIGTLDVLSKTIPWRKMDIELIGAFTNGEDALNFCQTHPPTVVLTDVEMPRLNGIDFVKRLKETSPDTTVIFISAFDKFNYVQHALRLEAFDYVLKPLDYKEVTKTIKSALDRRKMRFQLNKELISESELIKLLQMFKTQNIDEFIKGLIVCKNRILVRNPSSEEAFLLAKRIMQFFSHELGTALQLPNDLNKTTKPADTIIETAFQDLEQKLVIIWEDALDKNERFTYQIHKLIKERLVDPGLSLQFIGKELGYTPAYIGSCYKKITGTKLIDYIHQQRIKAAISLIDEGNKTIGEISRLVGFVNEAYFSTLFKKYTGETPSSFKCK